MLKIQNPVCGADASHHQTSPNHVVSNLSFSQWNAGVQKDHTEISKSFDSSQTTVFFAGKVEVSWNRGIHRTSILIGFSIINQPFGGSSILGNLQLQVITPRIFHPTGAISELSSTRSRTSWTPSVEALPRRRPRNAWHNENTWGGVAWLTSGLLRSSLTAWLDF